MGFRPGIELEEHSGAVGLVLGRQVPALGEVHAALAHARHRLRENGDLDDGSRLELGRAVVLVGAPRLDVARGHAHPALAPRLGPRHRGIEGRSGRRRRRARRGERRQRQDPRRSYPAYPSTLMPFSMRRTRPASTLPGPISSARSTPSRASSWTVSTQRTGESIWRARASRRASPRSRRPHRRWSRPAGARRRRAPRRAAASSSRAPATSARSGRAPTPAARSRAWPRARGTPRRRAPRPPHGRRSRSARASCSWPGTRTRPAPPRGRRPRPARAPAPGSPPWRPRPPARPPA